MILRHPIDDFVSSPSFSDFKVPELPNLGQLIKSEGFAHGMARFGELLTAWRTEFERALIERLKQLSAAVVTTEVAGDAATASPAATVDSVTPEELAALANQVQTLVDGLAAHIAATIAHGTTSRVVGESDEQPLEAKTIGQTVAKLATVTHLISRNTVDAGEVLHIPTNHNLVVAGPFTVNGTMTVDGYFAVVP